MKGGFSLLSLIVSLVAALLFVTTIGVAGLYLYWAQSHTESGAYYVTGSVSSDGEELTEEGVRKYLKADSLSEVMCLSLKDTGDCGVYMIDDGFSCKWREKKNEDVVIEMPKQKLRLKKSWGNLVYETTRDGKEIRIVLEPSEEVPECFVEHPEFAFGVNYDREDTENLCNYMMDGYYLIDEGVLYGKFFSGGKSVLGYRTVSGGKDIDAGKLHVIDKDGQGKFLVKRGNYIYYLWAPADGSTESIRRVNPDLGEVEVLREGNVDYVQVRFGKIYFADEKYKLHEMTVDGSKDNIVVDKEIYVPYVIDKGWIIYQDDHDGEKLHLASLTTDFDQSITRERTYTWTISGKKLFYTSTKDKKDEEKHKCRLHCLDLDKIKNTSGADEFDADVGDKYMGDVFEINSEFIFGGDGTFEPLGTWKKFSNKLYKSGSQKTYLMFVSGNYRICSRTVKNGGIVSIELENIKNGAKQEIIK